MEFLFENLRPFPSLSASAFQKTTSIAHHLRLHRRRPGIDLANPCEHRFSVRRTTFFVLGVIEKRWEGQNWLEKKKRGVIWWVRGRGESSCAAFRLRKSIVERMRLSRFAGSVAHREI